MGTQPKLTAWRRCHDEDRRICYALEILEHGYVQADLGLEVIAKSLNLSVSRFRYLFTNQVGIAPGQYLKSIRLERAKELLETSFLSVKEVMNAVGYRDISHFTREFKSRYQRSPSKFRTSSTND